MAKRIKRNATASTADVEPLWGQYDSDNQLNLLLNWYSYNKTQDDAKKYIVSYLKSKKYSKTDIQKVSSSKDRVNTSIAWVCRIILNGADNISSLYADRINSEIDRLLSVKEKDDEIVVKVKKSRPSVQENMHNQLCEYLGEINSHVDDILSKIIKNKDVTFSLKQWLASNSVSAIQTKNIKEHFSDFVLPELREAASNKCEQLKEGYSFLTKKQLKKYISTIEAFIEDCQENESIRKRIAKINRKPRNITKNPLKQVSKLKYLKGHENLKSIAPTRIIGANAIVLYNPSNRTVYWYKCDNNHGLGIKGSTLLNYDEASSICKTVRKPEDVIKVLLESGKVSVRKTIEDLTTKSKSLSGRINDKMIILRAF